MRGRGAYGSFPHSAATVWARARMAVPRRTGCASIFSLWEARSRRWVCRAWLWGKKTDEKTAKSRMRGIELQEQRRTAFPLLLKARNSSFVVFPRWTLKKYSTNLVCLGGLGLK